MKIRGQMYSGFTEPPDRKEKDLGNKGQETSLLTEKKTGVVLVCPYSYSMLCGYSRGPWVSYVTIDVFLVRVTKVTSRIGVS